MISPSSIDHIEHRYTRMVTGEKFYPYRVQRQYDIPAIAHHLSMICRFTGATSEFYPVAQHCLLCSALGRLSRMSARTQMVLLLHDAEEAMFNDLNPVAKHIAGDEYKKIAKTHRDAIVQQCIGVEPWKMIDWREIKRIDDLACNIEGSKFVRGFRDKEYARQALAIYGKWPELEGDLPPSTIRKRYIDRYLELAKEMNCHPKTSEDANPRGLNQDGIGLARRMS
jgi:5'-deoxynucleotidase YfbR-like HD superfamily hydrolase